jgi:hypothetical protein
MALDKSAGAGAVLLILLGLVRIAGNLKESISVVSIIPMNPLFMSYLRPEVSILNSRFEIVVLALISLTAVFYFRLLNLLLKVANQQRLTRV